MALTPDEKKIIDETHDTVITLKTVLLGANGNKGLSDIVEEHTKKINRITMILVGISSSGLLGTGIWGIVKVMLE